MIIDIKVVPRSGRQDIQPEPSGRLKVWLVSAPEDGKANKELLQLFSKRLRIPQGALEIIQGATSSLKRLAIEPFDSLSALYTALGFPVQERCC